MSFYLTAQHNLSVGMHSDSQNHYVFCQLKPITETHNLFFSFFFSLPSDFSAVIGEKHSFELSVTIY